VFFIRVMEIVVGALLLLGFITQILIPAYKGRRWFPLFRKKEKELEELFVAETEKKASADAHQRIRDIRSAARPPGRKPKRK
jgi:hypothetical protein